MGPIRLRHMRVVKMAVLCWVMGIAVTKVEA